MASYIGLSDSSDENRAYIFWSFQDEMLYIQNGLKSINSLTGTDEENFNVLLNDETSNVLINPTGGKVGIGTSSPKYAVDIKGDLRVSGDLIISGINFSSIRDETVDPVDDQDISVSFKKFKKYSTTDPDTGEVTITTETNPYSKLNVGIFGSDAALQFNGSNIISFNSSNIVLSKPIPSVTITNATINSSTITTLNTATGIVTNLNSNSGTITTLNSTTGNISDLNITNSFIYKDIITSNKIKIEEIDTNKIVYQNKELDFNSFGGKFDKLLDQETTEEVTDGILFELNSLMIVSNKNNIDSGSSILYTETSMKGISLENDSPFNNRKSVKILGTNQNFSFTEISLSDENTIEFWIKFPSIIKNKINILSFDSKFILSIDSSNKIELNYNNYIVSDNIDISDWNHIKIEIKNDDVLLYINNIQSHTTDGSFFKESLTNSTLNIGSIISSTDYILITDLYISNSILSNNHFSKKIPYSTSNRALGKNCNFFIDEFGNAWFSNLKGAV